MANRTLNRVAFLAAMAFAVIGATDLARAASLKAAAPQTTTIESATRFVPLGIGKSAIIDLPRDTKDVLVADPRIANAVMRTSRRAYLIGVAVGQTNVFFFDADGNQIAGFDIAVSRDLNGVRAALKQMLPNSDVRVDGVADGVVLTGVVANQAESQQAFDVASRLVGDGSKVVNGLIVRGRDQVLLKVAVTEIQRDVIKQLGIDMTGSIGSVVNFTTSTPFGALGQPLNDTNLVGKVGSVSATLRAMERAGVVRTLAEPNLTAISGESATFVAGGEFPIPAGLSCDTSKSPPVCQPTISFKKFGVGLTFTPVVLSEGRISLKVATEVSDLSSENAMTLQTTGSNQSLTVPSLRVRRADTTVEIPSGGSLAMAGMIQEQTKQQINGLPGLQQVPVLGALFRSRDYVNRQSELVILVTPYVVRAAAQKDLSRPDDGFADASDPQTVLLGRLNRIYGVPVPGGPGRAYYGNYGFILD
jgi:pilus assembly protein CpaC